MAVTYNNITDGIPVSTFAANVNSFGNSVKLNIDTIENSIINLEANKISTGNTGMIYTVTTSGASVLINTYFQRVVMTNALALNKSNGHISVDVFSGIITFLTSGVYNIHFAGAMTADNGVLVTFNYNLNGVSVLSNPPKFEGKGASPVSISNSMFVEVVSGSSIYIEAKSSSTTIMTPIGCGLSVEKTHY